MKAPLLALILVSQIVHSTTAQEMEAYRIYDKSGKAVDFGKMAKGVEKSDVVFFGELHNNPICHWLQLELTKALDSKADLVLGAEWFELDDQIVIDEYLSGSATEKHLEREAKIWPNYKTDYRPILEYAHDHNLRFIATNVPRRYASLVSKSGSAALDSLSDASKKLLPELPYEVTEKDQGYEDMKTMMGGGHGHGMNIEYLIEAQALKDYTMASSIYQNRMSNEQFLHFNGNYHSKNYEGTVNYLSALDPKLKIAVIASVEAENLDWDESWNGSGDYIIVTPSSMTKTH